MSLPDELGRALHNSLGIRYEPDVLVPTVDHIEIKRIAVEGRQQVVSGTFAVTTLRLAGKSVLLIDDIITSGATIAECAHQLRKAGVTTVFAYTLGRTADFALRLSSGSSDETQVNKVSLVDPPRELEGRTRNL